METINGKLKCRICGKLYSHLGSHIWHGHKITAREYKTEYGLPYNMALISPEIILKKKEAEANNPSWKNNFKRSIKYQFKKGKTGQRRISQHEREVTLARINEVNKNRKPEPCPVCKMIYQNVDSHLATKHKLLRIK